MEWCFIYYTKNVIIAFKILISNANGLVLVHHDSQKIKKAINFIGPVVTRFNMLLAVSALETANS